MIFKAKKHSSSKYDFSCDKVRAMFSSFIEADLDERLHQKIESHLEDCADCRRELSRFSNLLEKTQALPKNISPQRDLFDGIQSKLRPRTSMQSGRVLELPTKPSQLKKDRRQLSSDWPQKDGVFFWKRAFLAAALVLFAIAGFRYFEDYVGDGWIVRSTGGAPKIAGRTLESAERLPLGEWLETDGQSRAVLNVGQIGEIILEPGSRLQLLTSTPFEHRISLERGKIFAKIWAPPQFFYVETPSALAVDLGCAYTLEVLENGGNKMYVSKGFVAFVRDGVKSVVPAGAACETSVANGPGAPYFVDASPRFLQALRTIQGDSIRAALEDVKTLCGEARKKDALTLWSLLPRFEKAERAVVFDRLNALLPAPVSVTREGILENDSRMLERWREKLNLPWAEDGRTFWQVMWDSIF